MIITKASHRVIDGAPDTGSQHKRRLTNGFRVINRLFFVFAIVQFDIPLLRQVMRGWDFIVGRTVGSELTFIIPDQLVMPVGLPIGGKEPMAVAVSIVAQLLQQYHQAEL